MDITIVFCLKIQGPYSEESRFRLTAYREYGIAALSGKH